jgi:tetratricopeptide (TPR) repeat protein
MAAAKLTDVRLRAVSLAGWLAVLASITAAQTRPYLSLEHLYRHVLALDPASYIAANNLGLVYAGSNRFPEAMNFFVLAAQNGSRIADTRRALWNGFNVGLRCDDAKAIEACSRLMHELAPTLASRSIRTLALLRAGEVAGASNLLFADQADQPESHVPEVDVMDMNRLARAEVAVAVKSPAVAFREVDSLYANTKNDWIKLQSGVHFAAIGVDGRAAKIFGELRNSARHAGQAYYGLGELAIEQGDLGVAESCFQLAISKDPLLIEAYVRLSRILLREGRCDEAESWLTKGLLFSPASDQLIAALSQVQVARASPADVSP